jgi:ribose transport system ATP-binding protein
MGDSILELKGITKSFPGVLALKGVDVTVKPNEILGLVGENGAGKSTLMKIMIGLQGPDSGEIRLRGEATKLDGPSDAIRKGIGMVFQEGCMIPNLSVADNLFLGNEKTFMRGGFISTRRMLAASRRQLAQVGLGSLDPRRTTGALSAAEKQMVEIARLLWLSEFHGVENPILILDEPTTVLQESEVKMLFGILGELKKRATIIFISHRLEEVVMLSDRIIVLKDGSLMAELPRGLATVHGIEKLMVGHEMAEEHYRESMQIEPKNEVVLKAQGLSVSGRFADFSLELRSGEILSLVGLLGSGKEEVCACLGGSTRPDSGRLEIGGQVMSFSTPRDAIGAGIGCVPIDRRSDGLATSLDVADNVNLLVLGKLRTGPLLSPKKERENAGRWVKECLIKTPSLTTACGTLSGGNQQKVVIAKWLAAEAKILILDHPTRGIDVGAKDEIYRRIRELSAAGMSIIMMCDTLEEDIGLCNRMIVMKDGVIMREIPCAKGRKPAAVEIIDYIV